MIAVTGSDRARGTLQVAGRTPARNPLAARASPGGPASAKSPPAAAEQSDVASRVSLKTMALGAVVAIASEHAVLLYYLLLEVPGTGDLGPQGQQADSLPLSGSPRGGCPLGGFLVQGAPQGNAGFGPGDSISLWRNWPTQPWSVRHPFTLKEWRAFCRDQPARRTSSHHRSQMV